MQAWATGNNGNGQLGLGDTTDRSTPEQMLSPSNIVQAAAGTWHTVLVDGSGVVRASCLSCLSLAPTSKPECCLCVCGLASLAVLSTSRVVCCAGVRGRVCRGLGKTACTAPL